MPYHVSYFFKQNVGRIGGWSENYWNNLTDLPTVNTKAQAFLPVLRALHGRQSVCNHIRVSDAATFRVTEITLVPGDVNPEVLGTTFSDYPTTALGTLLGAAPSYKVRAWLKGTWDSIIDVGGFYDPGPNFTINVGAWAAHLTTGTNGWALRVIDRAQPLKVVRDITQAGVVTVLAHGYADNSRVRISRSKGLTQANALWRITVIDGDSFSLQGWVTPAVATPYQGNGTVRLQSYIYPSINSAKIERATKRNIGRPFGLLSGRRTTR